MSPNNAPRGTILVADDNQPARDMLEMMRYAWLSRVRRGRWPGGAGRVLRQEPVDMASSTW